MILAIHMPVWAAILGCAAYLIAGILFGGAMARAAGKTTPAPPSRLDWWCPCRHPRASHFIPPGQPMRCRDCEAERDAGKGGAA